MFLNIKVTIQFMKYWINKVFVIVALAFASASCASYKDILYFQDIEKSRLEDLTPEYEAVIKKDDRLSIVVSGPDKTVCAPYNLTIGEGTSANPETATLSYLVDSEGYISFPILGRIHVEGMTRRQLSDYLTERIGVDVRDPIVSVNFKNYKVSVLGEVKTPGTYTMDSEKNNILQALSMAGDLNLTAKRDGILLLREVDGRMTYTKIDLKKSEILDSPYFYLQQNDVIYVPANASRVASANTATGVWSLVFSSITTVMALVSFILK